MTSCRLLPKSRGRSLMAFVYRCLRPSTDGVQLQVRHSRLATTPRQRRDAGSGSFAERDCLDSMEETSSNGTVFC